MPSVAPSCGARSSNATIEREARTERWQVIGSDGAVLFDGETSGQAAQWISLR
jgi:hypothetical protein